MKFFAWFCKILILYSILSLSCLLMLKTIINYSTFKTDVQFLVFKQEYLSNSIWKFSFYVHVFSAIVSLAAGFTQFSKELLIHKPHFHKILGRIYVWNILFINFPVTLVMSIYANGGWLGKSAFLILNSLWFIFTYLAVRYAIQGNFKSHKEFMIRSFALTFSAITLRTWKLLLTQGNFIPVENVYIIESWLGFLPNIVVAELIILFINKKNLSLKGDNSQS